MFMLKPILKNLFKKSATVKYPLVKRPTPEIYRGEIVMDEKECIMCKICATKCPAQCIHIEAEKGLWRRSVHECVFCGVCADVCPKKCLTLTNVYAPPVTQEEFLEFHAKPKAAKKAAPKPADAEAGDAADAKETAKKTAKDSAAEGA